MVFYKESILKTEEYVKQFLDGEASGHDWWHIHRVRQMALNLASEQSCNLFIIEMAALLHDLADDKITNDGISHVQNWLKQLQIDEADIDHIMEIITTMSFKGGQTKHVMKTIEGKIVQDADRLDAIGAIGIARTFAYAGNRHHPIYHPDLPIRDTMTYDEYRNGESSAINHFYEKLLKLADQMNTKKAKKLAMERHAFLEQFLSQFFKEWNGKA